MQSLSQNRFDSQWPTHAMLLWAGVLFYLALVATLLYTIVMLIHADEQAPPFIHAVKVQPMVLAPPRPVFAVSVCTGSPEWDAPGCTSLPKASAGTVPGKRHAHVATGSNAGINNLLWAPPGAVWMDHQYTAAIPPAATLADASRSNGGNGEWSTTGAPHVLPVMASR